MKKIFLLPLIALILLLQACENDPGIYKNFTLDYTYRIEVPSNSILNLPINLLASERESNAESQFEVNDTRKDLVEEVYIERLYLEIIDPDNEDFSFLESAALFIDAEDLPETKIAEKDPVPANTAQELVFDLFEANLAEFIQADEFGIRVNAVTDEEPTQDISINAYATFNVRAKVL